MSNINYPTNLLPHPSIDVSEDYNNHITSTQFEINLRQRQRYSYYKNDKSVSWLFNRFQFDVFQAFVKHTLKGGTRKFNIEIPGLYGFPLTKVSLLYGQYSAQNESNFWRVRAVLRVENQETFDSSTIETLIGLTDQSAIDSFIASNYND
jgi:hypothetical protein